MTEIILKGTSSCQFSQIEKNTPHSGSYSSTFNIADKNYTETLNISYDSPYQGIKGNLWTKY